MLCIHTTVCVCEQEVRFPNLWPQNIVSSGDFSAPDTGRWRGCPRSDSGSFREPDPVTGSSGDTCDEPVSLRHSAIKHSATHDTARYSHPSATSSPVIRSPYFHQLNKHGLAGVSTRWCNPPDSASYFVNVRSEHYELESEATSFKDRGKTASIKMSGGAAEEGNFMRSQAYRSLRNFTRFYMGKEKNKVRSYSN